MSTSRSRRDRQVPVRAGRYGRQPAWWVLRERGTRHADLIPVTGRSSGYVSAVLSGFSVPTSHFVESVSAFLKLPPEELFTGEVLAASRRRPQLEVDIERGPGRPPTARVGRYGRQPAYWLLRRRGIAQARLAFLSGRSMGHVNSALNGFSRPYPSLVEAAS